MNLALTIDLPRQVAEHIGEFRGRGWLLRTLVEWWDHGDERMFLLTGDPGAGKSMVLAWLAGLGPLPADPGQRSWLVRLREAVRAAHFCQASSRNVTPHAFAEAVANQLTQNVPGFADALADTLADRVSIVGTVRAEAVGEGARVTGVSIGRLDLGLLSDELSFDHAFSVPLKRLHARGEVEPILLLVDGLDEAQTYGGTTLSELLSRNTDLAPSLRILASTRDDPRVLRFFRAVRPFDLKRDAIGCGDDVREYVYERISALDVSAERRLEFGNRLADRADGVFLYASMVLDDLLAASPPARDLSTYALPEKLGGLYHGFLTRELGKNDRLWFDTYEPLFGLIAVAQGDGLTSAQLTALAGKDLRAALRASKQYLAGELPGGPFRLFHKSFADFLLEPDVENPDYRVEGGVWHNRIADYYLRAFADGCAQTGALAKGRVNSSATIGAGVTDVAMDSAIDDYGLNNLCTHLVAAGRAVELITLINEPWMRLRRERAGGVYGPFQADVDVAWRATTGLREEISIDSLVHLRAAAFVVLEQVALYDDEDLSIFVRLGRVAEASAHARLRATPKERSASLRRVIGELGHDQPMLAVLVADTRQAAAMISDTLGRVQSLGYLVATLSTSNPTVVAEILDEMREAVDTLEDLSKHAQAQRSLVEAFGAAGRLDEAERLAMSIDDPVQCAFALHSIAVNVAKSGHFAHALAMAHRIGKLDSVLSESAIRRTASEALSEIALAQAIARDPGAASTFVAAEKAAKDIHENVYEERDRNDALYGLGSALVQSGDLPTAMRIAESTAGWQRDHLLVDLVNAHAARGEFSMARALLRDCEDTTWRSLALRALAVQFGTAGRYEDARSVEGKLATEADRIHAMLGIAAALQDRGDSRSEQLLTEAASRATALDGDARADAFERLTRVHLAAGNVSAATETFRSKHSEAIVGRDRQQYCAALRGVAAALAVARHPQADTAIAAARRACAGLDIGRERETHALAKALADVERFEDAWSVLGVDLQSTAAWSHLALRLESHGDRKRAVAAINRALQVALSIPNDTFRDEDLLELALPLKTLGLLDTLEDAGERIKDIVRRCQVWTQVAVCRHEAEPARSRELFERAERAARAEYSDYSCSQALAHIVAGLAECRRFDEAWRLVGTMAEGNHRVRAICALARHLTEAGVSEGQSLLDEGVRIATSRIDHETMRRWRAARERRKEAARQDCENNPGAAVTWAEANLLAGSPWADWIWQEPQYRAEALVEIAAAVSGESERDRVFVLAHVGATAIEHENPRSETLRQLVRRMIAVGRRDLAEQALADLHRENERRGGIADLTNAYLKAGDLDAALRIARLETSEYYRRELTGDVATALAGAGRIRDALQAIDEQTLDGFIGSLARAHSAWRTAPPGAIEASLRAVIGVAAWVRSDWRDLRHALFGN
jgi:tetratricopeptide (TPR) repeat protein